MKRNVVRYCDANMDVTRERNYDEAFKRFSQAVHLDRRKHYSNQDLINLWGKWSHREVVTGKQQKMVTGQAKDEGFAKNQVVSETHRIGGNKVTAHRKDGSEYSYIPKAKFVRVYRDLATGRFVSRRAQDEGD
jgi:hypothetical protein